MLKLSIIITAPKIKDLHVYTLGIRGSTTLHARGQGGREGGREEGLTCVLKVRAKV